MRRWGCEWDRASLRWRQVEQSNPGLTMWDAQYPMVGEALAQHAPWKFR